MPENMRVPRISASSLDVLAWNKRFGTYFEVLFAFANANLHDDDVIIFTHATGHDVSKSIHKWTHTEDLYIVED